MLTETYSVSVSSSSVLFYIAILSQAILSKSELSTQAIDEISSRLVSFGLKL